MYLVKGEYSNNKNNYKEDLGYIRRQLDNVEQKPKQRDFKTGIG